MKPDDPVLRLKGVGPGRGRLLSNLGIEKIDDLLYYLPKRYEDRRVIVPISKIIPGEPAVVRGVIRNFSARAAKHKKMYVATFDAEDASGRIRAALFGCVRTFSSIRDGLYVFLYGVPALADDNCLEFVSPDYEVSGAENFLPAWLRLWPVYPTTKGLSASWLAGVIHSCALSPDLSIEEDLPARIIQKYSFPGIREAFLGIHAPDSLEEMERARDRLAYQELYENQVRAAAIERARAMVPAKRMGGGAELEARFIGGLPFELTDSQADAVSDIANDMDGAIPMRRLVVGDVGSGKTAVVTAAAARCAGAGHQAAVLVPTTILAGQFFAFCEKRMAALGVRAAKISGGMRRSERDELLWKLRDGEIDLLVGTHAMLSEGVAFKSLGLLVIDEQQRFGVRQRDRIASGNMGAHVLMTTATPIPRTLRMALYGDISYTRMASRPDKGRVITKLVSDNHIKELYKFLADKINRSGERCYWVCPRIGDGDSSVANRERDIKKNMKGVNVEIMTGAMSGDEKAAAIGRFASNPGILVSTTVIEVGVDVKGANIMIIESAASYGLPQLHQIRGRAGRGESDGICVLLDTAKNLSGSKRLEFLLECSDGFRIAEEDLRLRGAGEYLGVRQHGDENFRAAVMPRDEKWFTAARGDAGMREPAINSGKG